MTLDGGYPVIVVLKSGETIEAEAWGESTSGLQITTLNHRERMFIPWLNIAAVKERSR